jgi:hypothetical protein
MNDENSDWVDEIVEAERGIEADELTESGRDKFLGKYDGVEDVWSDVSTRRHEDSSFRIPVEEEDPLSCLGRALMVGVYDELSGGRSDSHITVYFDDKWSEDGTATMKKPHVTATVNGTEYGAQGSEKDADLPMSSIADLYKVGLGVQVFNQGEDIEGLDYDELYEWGEDIEETYSEETEGPNSEYLRRQGLLMQQDAEEAQMKDSIGGDNVYIE